MFGSKSLKLAFIAAFGAALPPPLVTSYNRTRNDSKAQAEKERESCLQPEFL
ncbi:MAG TPA: hypothetical protein VKE91_12570 [Blastocatellia bacterium]|nr:hypothetical protein [Blastocatellia bacterium]